MVSNRFSNLDGSDLKRNEKDFFIASIFFVKSAGPLMLIGSSTRKSIVSSDYFYQVLPESCIEEHATTFMSSIIFLKPPPPSKVLFAEEVPLLFDIGKVVPHLLSLVCIADFCRLGTGQEELGHGFGAILTGKFTR